MWAYESSWLGAIPNCQKKITFDDYSVKESFKGTPAKKNLESIKRKNLRFFLGLDDQSVGNPNFAGTYHVVMGGCGTDCQRFVAYDVRNGEPYDLGITATLGIKYRKNSSLIIMNPEEEIRDFLKSTGIDSYPTIYLKWIGEKLDPICKNKIFKQLKK